MVKNKKITVMQIIHSLHIGGAEKVLVNIANLANKDNFNIIVCCIKEKGVLAEQLEQNGIKVILVPKIGRSKYTKIIQGLRSVIKDHKPDIIHTHGDIALIDLGPVYLLDGLFRKFPRWIHTFHFGNYPHIKKRYLYSQAIFSKFVNRLIAVSDSQKVSLEKCMKIPEDKIQVIHNGVNKNPYIDDESIIQSKKKELGLDDNLILIGCIAVLTEQKGIIYLLNSVQSVVTKYENVRFLIIGGGPLQEELEQRVVTLGLEKYIIFSGWRDDALQLFSILDIFVMPSLWEAFSVVLIEAMAARRKIVATDVADNRRIIDSGKSGIIVPAMSSEAITCALIEVLENNENYNEMGKEAYSLFSENYTVDKMISKYEQLFSKEMNF